MGEHVADNEVLERVLGELASLRAENQRLAARVDALDRESLSHDGKHRASNSHPPNAANGETSESVPGLSRRRLLTRLAGAGAVGAGVLAVGDTFAPRAAQAAAGDNMILGQNNDAGTNITELSSTNVGQTLQVDASAPVNGRFPFAIATSSNGSGVDATGIVYGLRAAGGLAPLLLGTQHGAVGPPTSGPHLQGEIFLDTNAALFQCVASGTPGTWVRVGFNPLHPTRILDTRTSSPIGPNSSINLAVGGHFGVPTQASAIVANATVTQGTAQSFLTIYPEGTTRPMASNLNWVAGQTIANLVTVKLGTSNGITIFNAAGTVEVVLDLAGFYS